MKIGLTLPLQTCRVHGQPPCSRAPLRQPAIAPLVFFSRRPGACAPSLTWHSADPGLGKKRKKKGALAWLQPRIPSDRPQPPPPPGPTGRLWEIEAKQGLPSADRNNKATLLLTGPFRTAKSSAKDLIPHVSKLQYANSRRPFYRAQGVSAF